MIGALMIAAAILAQASDAPTATPATAAAEPQAHTVAPAVAVAAEPGEKPRVCRKEHVVGTLFHRTVCMKHADYSERRRLDRADLERAQKTSIRPK